MFGLWSWMLLLFGASFVLAPRWLVWITAFGNIKYGVWTVTLWATYWSSTSAAFGAADVTAQGILMTATHLGMIVQGMLLLAFVLSDLRAALLGFGWFALSDFVDYALGYHPQPIPEPWVSLDWMQWHTICVTVLLSLFALWMSQNIRLHLPQRHPIPSP